MAPDARNREVLGNRVDYLQADDARSTAARPVAHEAHPGAKSIEAPARDPRIAVRSAKKLRPLKSTLMLTFEP